MYVAVYGTLRSDSDSLRNPVMGEFGELVGPCWIPGVLYSVHGAFPALVAGAGKVRGQLWSIHEDQEFDTLVGLDAMEGYRPGRPEGSLYVRQTIRLLAPAVEAETYVWNSPLDRLWPIPSGDWMKR